MQNTNDKQPTIEENLEFLGLDVENVPEFLKNYKEVRYLVSKSYDDKDYKVYKYIDIDKIQIRITTIDRLNSIGDKFAQSANIYDYMLKDIKDEKDLLRQTVFLSMLQQMSQEKVLAEAEKQEELKQDRPFRIKFKDNFMWQIYYSKLNDIYFMLVPSDRFDNSKMFYLLREQIKYFNNPDGNPLQIYVPICGIENTGEILTKEQISELENYLNLITGNFPNICEIDTGDNVFMNIVGEANLYETIKTKYKVDLKTGEESINFYKLLKALFILKTEVKKEYNFNMKIDADNNLKIYNEQKEMTYEYLSEFLKEEYKLLENLLNEDKKEYDLCKEKYEKLKEEIFLKEKEYFYKEKQISTYMEYKKTFLGRIKYYFKSKKNKDYNVGEGLQPTHTEDKEIIKEEQEQSPKYFIDSNIVSNTYNYTLEDLINVDKIYSQKHKELKDILLDTKSLETRMQMLNKKIENAKKFIEEIDSHKKSILEFWKFSKKEELVPLPEGNEEIASKIKKIFTFEDDVEDISIEFDRLQRRELLKQEQDAVFVIKELNNTNVLDNLENTEFLQQHLESLKENQLVYEISRDSLGSDVFGNIAGSSSRTRYLGSTAHRENEKNLYNILGINKHTTVEEYKNNLSKVIEIVNSAFKKIKLKYDTPVYMIVGEHTCAQGFVICTLNSELALEKIKDKDQDIVLKKFNLKEGTQVLIYTNIMLFDNKTETLPVGMNIGADVLIDTNRFNIELKEEKIISTNFYNNEDLDIVNPKIKEITIKEYDLDLKN